MSLTKEEGIKMLLDRGMNEDEAEKFWSSHEIVTKGLELPAEEALDLMNKMSEFGAFTGPVRFFILLTKDNEERLLDLVRSTTNKDVVDGGLFDVNDMGKDPIGDYHRRIREGFSGTAEFAGKNTALVN